MHATRTTTRRWHWPTTATSGWPPVAGDPARADALAARLIAGSVWCNTHQVAPPGLGWGGMRGSGIGRELGRAGLEAYLETRYVTRPA